MVKSRSVLVPLLVLAAAASACCLVALSPSPQNLGGFIGPSPRATLGGARSLVAGSQDQEPPSKVALLAKGGGAAAAEADPESVEVSGFAGFVVGLALLPHVIYALVCAFNVAVKGDEFAVGLYGTEFISISVAVGVTMWSFGSFAQRGRGLPAGPLGLLGLSEGLSYLATLALIIATVASSFRAPGGTSTKPAISAPSLPSLPAVKAPDFKAPDFKVPSFKAPDVKLPEIKIPDVKVPAIKVPDVKLPDVKVPEVKVPDIPKPAPKPAPEAEKTKPEKPKPAPESEKAKPAPKPAPEVKAPAAKKDAAPDFDSLFD